MLLLACRVARVRALQAPRKFDGRLRALASTVAEPGSKVPVTLLSGFLGTGKTTLLRNLLEEASQDKDSKVGVVVNDMAAVNIDAKITARRLDLDESDAPKMQGAAEFVEIGDGCVCCSMADELFTTLAELAAVSSMKGYKYNHIVIEATGIAEPRSIRDQFQDAEAAGMPLMEEVELSTLVTVVDSAAFLDAYAETASIAQRPDLAAPVDDDPSPFLMARFDHSLQRSVVDLLVEQVECADVLLLNKKDLVTQQQMDRLAEIMKALNPTAIVKQCEFGDAALHEVLGVAGDEGAARIGPVDEHKVAVAASKGANCDDPACTDPSHLHAHDSHDHAAKEEHSHAHKEEEACADPTCTDPTHDHSHKRCINQIVAARRVLWPITARCSQQGHPTHWLIRAQATRRTTTLMRRRRPARTRRARTRRTTTATRRTTIRTATRTTPSASTRSSTPRGGPSRRRGSRSCCGPCRPTSRRPSLMGRRTTRP